MFCYKCGKELQEGATFCPNCGTEQPNMGPKVFGGNAEEVFQRMEDNVNESIYAARTREEAEMRGKGGNFEANRDKGGSLDDKTADIIVKVISGLLMAYYGYLAIRNVIAIFQTFANFASSLSYGFHFGIIISFVFIALILLSHLAIIATAFVFGFKRKETQTSELLFAVCVAAVLKIVAKILYLIFFRVYYGYVFTSWWDVLAIIAGIALYFVVMLLSGHQTLLALNYSDITGLVMDSLNAVGEAFSSMSNKEAGATVAAGAAATAAAATGASAAQASNNSYRSDAPQAQAAGDVAPTRMKTDRGLLAYILLTIVTCGIYSWWFVYTVARDVNIMCKQDGTKVGGLLAFILLNIVTCGFYSWYWLYKIGNRVHNNAPYYGINIQENGTTILMWTLVGLITCYIGNLIAMNILIKNINSLAMAYNRTMFGDTGSINPGGPNYGNPQGGPSA